MALTQTLIACHDCDLLHRVQALPKNSKARCCRCGALLYVHYPETINRTLAFALTGLVLLVIANTYPFLSLESQGSILETSFITGTILLARQSLVSLAGLAILVLLTSLLVPGVLLTGLVYVLWPMKKGHQLPGCRHIFSLILTLRPWSMTEVFLLGILVSVVKLSKLATIIPGPALYSFLGLVFVLTAVNAFLDPYTIWEKMSPCP